MSDPEILWSGPPSPRSRRFAWIMRWTMRPLIVVMVAIWAFVMRVGPAGIEMWGLWSWLSAYNDGRYGLAPLVRGTSVERIRLPACRAEYIRAAGLTRAPGDATAILYTHGGGYVAGGLGAYRRFVSSLSKITGTTVLNVGYRLLPRFPITHAIDDGVSAYRRLLADGYAPERIVLAGDSAGGGLAFLIAHAVTAAGLPRPAAVIGLSPWADLDVAAKLAHASSRTDPVIPIHTAGFVVEHLIQRGAALDLNLSPVNLDLSALPPCLIHVGTTEVLALDAVALAQRLADDNVPVTLKYWQGQVHVFHVLALDALPEVCQALREIGAFISERTVAATAATAQGISDNSRYDAAPA